MSIEKVFIAWGGNQSLAMLVDEELSKNNFTGVVGGGDPTDMFIGSQVFSQINQCTRAILLVETRQDGSLSGNLMFEWGYLTGKMDTRKIHIFLIGESKKALPSDLVGIWATKIISLDKTRQQIAQEIASVFFEATSLPIDIDKMQIFSRWSEIKHKLSVHTSEPVYSEIELAHYLLHSIEACYYYMEQEELLSIVEKIIPVSSVLDFTIKIVRANIKLFEESTMLLNALEFDIFTDLRPLFETKFDFSNQDENLHLWLRYFCSNRLALLYMFIMRNNNNSNEDIKEMCFQKVEEYSNESLQILSEIVEKYPQETIYTKLYVGYVYRDLFKLYRDVGDNEKSAQCIDAASTARQLFYTHYQHNYPSDRYLIKHFAEEYYLSCIERLNYIKDPFQRKIDENAVRSFLLKVEKESGRQHILLEQLRAAFADRK
jgi:tetratricopeptide (TPR) repeat protein